MKRLTTERDSQFDSLTFAGAYLLWKMYDALAGQTHIKIGRSLLRLKV